MMKHKRPSKPSGISMALVREKEDIKAALATAYAENDVWQVISAVWFDKWKLYVNFDDNGSEELRSQEQIDGLYPGEIDNNNLLRGFELELRRDLALGIDYILLPGAPANMLIQNYGGGPSLPRTVSLLSSMVWADCFDYGQSYQVNLYPIRVDAFFVDPKNKEPVQEPGYFMRQYFSHGTWSLDKVVDILFKAQVEQQEQQQRWNCHYRDAKRYWLRDTTERKRSNLLTLDTVEWDDGWRIMYSKAHRERSIQEVLGVKDCIELLIEVIPHSECRPPKERDWPRYQELHRWKHALCIGDIVDVFDSLDGFVPARLIGFDDNPPGLHLHVINNSAGYDIHIPSEDIEGAIHPLFSHTGNSEETERDVAALSALIVIPKTAGSTDLTAQTQQLQEQNNHLEAALQAEREQTSAFEAQMGTLQAQILSMEHEAARYQSAVHRLFAEADYVQTLQTAEDVDTLTDQLKTALDRLNKRKSMLLAEKLRCIICHDQDKTVLFLPCRHLCLCEDCDAHSTPERCPMCREGIVDRINVYA